MALDRKVTVRVNISAQSTVGAVVDRDNQKIAQMQATLARKQSATIMPTTLAGQSPQAPVTIATRQPMTMQDRFARRLAMRGQRAEFIAGAGAGLFQQVAMAEAQAGQERRIMQLQASLVNLQRPEEAAQVAREAHLSRMIGYQNRWLQASARYGRIGAAIEMAQPAFGAARTIGMVGGGIVAASVASNQVASEQLTGSFKMLAGEMSIALTPAVARASGWLQQAATTIRNLDSSTKGTAGSVLFYGTATAATIGGLGLFAKTTSDAIHGLRTFGQWVGLAGDGLRGMQAAATVVQTAQTASAVSGAAGNLAGAGSVGGGAAVGSRGLGIGLGPAALVVAGALAAVEVGHLLYNRNDPATVESFRNRNWYSGGQIGMRAGAALGRGEGIGGAWSAAFGGGERAPVVATFDRQGQRGELGSGYEAAQLALYQGSPADRDLEARELREMTDALRELNGTIRDRVPPREGL